MTTDTLVTSGQPNTATDSSQTAPSATDNQTGAPDAQQQPSSTDTPAAKPVEGTADQSAAGDKPAGDGEPAADDDKPTGAPEQYEDFTAPEGVKLDAEVAGEFKSLAKELNLPQDQAQKVADLGVKLAQKWQAQQAAVLAETAAKWAQEAQTDAEFGGDKLPENLAVAKKALNDFGSEKLQTLLHESGLGNHPEVIRLLVNAGKAISEDRIVAGKSGTAPAVSTAQRMFPNMNP